MDSPRSVPPRAWHPSLGGRGEAQPLLNGVPDVGGRAGLVQVRLATLRQECGALDVQGIPGEKDHPLAQGGRLLLHDRREGRSVEGGHMQVTQDNIVTLRAELGQRVLPIGRRVHGVAIPVQEPGQPPDKACLIVNQQDRRRRVHTMIPLLWAQDMRP
jgi:hypothetical protein